MFRLDDIHLKPPVKNEIKELAEKVAAFMNINEAQINKLEILKRSLDARKKNDIKFVYSVVFDLTGVRQGLELAGRQLKRHSTLQLYKPTVYELPNAMLRTVREEQRPLIVGCGPAGLFCAYVLAKQGLKPIIVERGETIVKREKSVQEFWNSGKLNPESNVQFGEGGAGTFSDGKLYTGNSDKDGAYHFILRTFVEYGADPQILYDSHPHIGTDVLKNIIVNMRYNLERMGAEFLFETRFIKPLINDKGRAEGAELLSKGRFQERKCGSIILCTGHSARDSFLSLHECGIEMESKSFAVGLRVQHEQKMINDSQYGKGNEALKLPTAAYKLVTKASSGRGVFSFCMCPGGYVVDASSEKGRLAVNGMSYHGRSGANANSAIVVSVGPEEFGNGLFDGMEFQKKMEETAFKAAGGKIPVQSLMDYKARNGSVAHKGIEPAIKGAWAYAPLNGILPQNIEQDIIEAFDSFGRSIEGFDMPQALLAGVESRTSSPVKILRNESGQSNIGAVFPCGEGAGYAGGITSAAADGIRIAEKVIKYMQHA